MQNRTRLNVGCPYCSNREVLKGFNDLETKFPEIAKEADGWDPSELIAGSIKKMSWKCSLGHSYSAKVINRTFSSKGCPYCVNQKVLKGFNDLETKFPEIAKEADGWDPATVIAGGKKTMSWKCDLGHRWKAKVEKRVGENKTNCPYCSNQKVLKGFNDLETKFPEIAKEANGWDPATVIAGSGKRMSWRCSKNHIWNTPISNRTSSRTSCPKCADYGFNPGKPSWFYLMERKNEQQFGITNDLETRLKNHKRNGWKELEVIGPIEGSIVQKTERDLKKWLKVHIGCIPNTQENWSMSKMKINSLAELRAKSGIETSIF